MCKSIFGVVDSWSFFVGLGVLTALLLFRYLSTVYKLSDKAFNIYGLIIVLSIVFGFFSAMLFQAFYAYLDTGVFKLKGMTFMGGLLGAIILFFVLSALAICVFKKDKLFQQLWSLICIAPICITIAHSLGRMGCTFAGCCYGKETSSFLGIDFHIAGDFFNTKRIPTQLFESIFLFVLCITLIILVLKYKKYSLTPLVYLFSYSVFRFIIEFFRDDYRGGKGFLSPSQWQSVLMLLIGVSLAVYMFVLKRIPFNKKQDNLSGFLFDFNKEIQ